MSVPFLVWSVLCSGRLIFHWSCVPTVWDPKHSHLTTTFKYKIYAWNRGLNTHLPFMDLALCTTPYRSPPSKFWPPSFFQIIRLTHSNVMTGVDTPNCTSCNAPLTSIHLPTECWILEETEYIYKKHDRASLWWQAMHSSSTSATFINKCTAQNNNICMPYKNCITFKKTLNKHTIAPFITHTKNLYCWQSFSFFFLLKTTYASESRERNKIDRLSVFSDIDIWHSCFLNNHVNFYRTFCTGALTSMRVPHSCFTASPSCLHHIIFA